VANGGEFDVLVNSTLGISSTSPDIAGRLRAWGRGGRGMSKGVVDLKTPVRCWGGGGGGGGGGGQKVPHRCRDGSTEGRCQ